MRLQRLLRMGPEEISIRALQELSKAVERVSASWREAAAQPAPLRGQLDPARCADVLALYKAGRPEEAEAALLARFTQQAPQRFFAGLASDSVRDLMQAEYPRERELLIGGAEEVLQGRFGILGYGRLSFGSPPDWHLDPVSGKRAELTHWSRVPYLDEQRVGDSKVTWELSRHQWLLELGQAWRFTGDERYAQAFARLLQDWMRSNPPRQGINWTSALEVSLRLISWCWALCLFRGAAALTPALFARMLAWLGEHVAYVERYLSYYFSPNTHLTGEALGLFYAGCLLPELRAARRWRALGAKILIEQLERQVHEDGVYFEQSSRYQCYTVEFYLHLLLLARRNAVELPPTVGRRVEKMLDVLLALRHPDGSLPQIGDADGGWTVPLLRRPAQDCRNLFSIAALLFQRGDYAWAAGEAGPEALWLLGPAAHEDFAALPARAPADARPRFFREGGYAVLRSGWQSDAHHLVMDAGPIGAYAHGHADLLSLQLAVFGTPCLVDPGTGCYPPSSPWRQYLRGSAAHNTLTVDGLNQAEPAGPFGWRSRPSARWRQWEGGPLQSRVDAEHAAYGTGEARIRHRRRLLFVQKRFFVVVDDVLGEGAHRIDLRWQFAPLALTREDTCLRARTGQGQALLLRVFSAQPLELQVREGEHEPRAGWVSPDYGQVLPAPQACYTLQAELPLRLVTLLYPLADAEAPAPQVEALLAEGSVQGLRGDFGNIVIDEHELGLQTGPTPWPCQGETDPDKTSTRM